MATSMRHEPHSGGVNTNFVEGLWSVQVLSDSGDKGMGRISTTREVDGCLENPVTQVRTAQEDAAVGKVYSRLLSLPIP